MHVFLISKIIVYYSVYQLLIFNGIAQVIDIDIF